MALHKNNLFQDEAYKGAVIQSLLSGIDTKWYVEFLDILEYVIDKRLKKISELQDFKETLYGESDIEIWELVLPSVRRVFGKIFITPPTILTNDRLQLFQLSFNIDNFLDYLVEMFQKTKMALVEFKFLDREAETLSLLVDNYIAGLIYEMSQVDDIKSEIRHLKIKKVTND